MQRDIGGVAEVRCAQMVDDKLLAMCRDELDAVNLCIDMSRMSDEALCERLGIDKGHFSRIRKGRAHFPTAKRLDLMALAGNYAPLQFELYSTPLIQILRDKWLVEFTAAQRSDAPAKRWYA